MCSPNICIQKCFQSKCYYIHFSQILPMVCTLVLWYLLSFYNLYLHGWLLHFQPKACPSHKIKAGWLNIHQNIYSAPSNSTAKYILICSLHFPEEYAVSTQDAYQNDHEPSLIWMVLLKVKDSLTWDIGACIHRWFENTLGYAFLQTY